MAMSASDQGRRGAGVNRSGATDTTMLIWKTIEANPGITRDEIFAKIEHQIPAGWAKRKFATHYKITADKLSSAVILYRARSHVLGDVLKHMRYLKSVARDKDGHYEVLREILRYRGNPDHVDESGTKAAEQINAVYALPIAEGFVDRTESLGPRGKSRPTAKEWAALKRVVRAYRAS